MRADEEFLHAVYPRNGLVYRRFAISGASAEERRLVKSRLPMYACALDPGRALAIFWNGKDRDATLVCARLEPGAAPIEKKVRLELRRPVRELHFDCDQYGKFHVLASTADGLYYMRDGGPPESMAEGAGPFFPRVVSPGSVYLGFHTRQHGYRFVWYTRKPYHPRVTNFDMVG